MGIYDPNYYHSHRADILAKQKARLATSEGKAKRNAYLREYRKRNRERLAAKQRARRAANPEKYRQRDRAYYHADPAKMAEKRERFRSYQEVYRRRYYQQNKESINELIRRYRESLGGRPSVEREFLDSGEAAQMLGICVKTLKAWEAAGKVSCHRTAGNHRRFRREEIEQLAVKELPTVSGFIVPPNFDLIRTYEELMEYTIPFANREIGFLLLVGSPGSGKSRQMQNDVKGKGCVWIDNHASTLGLYCKVYQADHAPVVLDDVNHFFRDKLACSLMKALTQTEEIKHVSWESTTKSLEEKGVPTDFNTRSPVCMIANTWDAMNADFIAVQDRALPVAFFPSAETIHQRVMELGWCKDKEVVRFIGDHLQYIEQPTMRDYFWGEKYKRLGMDWRSKLLRTWGLAGLVGPVPHPPKARLPEAVTVDEKPRWKPSNKKRPKGSDGKGKKK